MSAWKEDVLLTITVLPLYSKIWHDLPTSLPPPKHKNISSSAGSTGSSGAGAMAAAFRLEAIFGSILPRFKYRVVVTKQLRVVQMPSKNS